MVGVSGGVDSAVTAHLLKKEGKTQIPSLILFKSGYKVIGLHMQNWEEKEETGIFSFSIHLTTKDTAQAKKT